jgi:hypothetical protein
MMLENIIRNNFSQIASTTMDQKVEILANFFSLKIAFFCFFDQTQLSYAFLRDIFENFCKILRKKMHFYIEYLLKRHKIIDFD